MPPRRHTAAALRCFAAAAALAFLPCSPLVSTASTAQPSPRHMLHDGSNLGTWLQIRSVVQEQPIGNDLLQVRRSWSDHHQHEHQQHHPLHPPCCSRAIDGGAMVSRLRGGIEDWEREYEEEAHLYTQGGTNAADQVPRGEAPKPWDPEASPEAIFFGEGEEVPDISNFYRYIQENPPPEGPPPGDGNKWPEVDDDHGGWLKDGEAWRGIDPRLRMAGAADKFTPEQLNAMGTEGAQYGPDGEIIFCPPGWTVEGMENELSAAAEYLDSLPDETIYAEAQKMLDENWRPYVHDAMEWAIRDGGLFRRPWLLDETKQVVKRSVDYLLRIGYVYDPKTGNYIPPPSDELQRQEAALRAEWQQRQQQQQQEAMLEQQRLLNNGWQQGTSVQGSTAPQQGILQPGVHEPGGAGIGGGQMQ